LEAIGEICFISYVSLFTDNLKPTVIHTPTHPTHLGHTSMSFVLSILILMKVDGCVLESLLALSTSTPSKIKNNGIK